MTKSLKILITGVAGFLGSHLAERLANMNHKVIGIDNMIGGYEDNVHEKIKQRRQIADNRSNKRIIRNTFRLGRCR